MLKKCKSGGKEDLSSEEKFQQLPKGSRSRGRLNRSPSGAEGSNCQYSKSAYLRQIQYLPRDQRKRGETTREFIDHKRELLKLNMDIQTKKEEIQMLGERVEEKERRLAANEERLKEDTVKFESFMKQNEIQAQEAVEQAEKMTKLRNENEMEVERLKQRISVKQGQIRKIEDELELCLRYKNFLNCLTPQSWFDEQRRLKNQRQTDRRVGRIRQRQEDWKVEHSKFLEIERHKIEYEKIHGGKSRKEYKERLRAQAQLKRMLQAEPPLFDDEPLTSSDEETPMYFKEPQKLLDVFSALEQQNFDLMQEEDTAKQSLDAMKKSCQGAIENMEHENEILKSSLDSLKRRAKLKEAVEANKEDQQSSLHTQPDADEVSKEDERFLATLQDKVREVYYSCGFEDSGSVPSTVYMLSELEGYTERILQKISELPADFVRSEEKKKEKKRRDDRREQKQLALEQARESRNRKARERAEQPPRKANGRPVSHSSIIEIFVGSFMLTNIVVSPDFNCMKMMLRSKPARNVISDENEEITQEELDEIRHLS